MAKFESGIDIRGIMIPLRADTSALGKAPAQAKALSGDVYKAIFSIFNYFSCWER